MFFFDTHDTNIINNFWRLELSLINKANDVHIRASKLSMHNSEYIIII